MPTGLLSKNWLSVAQMFKHEIRFVVCTMLLLVLLLNR
jgi:hypothetical protein